MFFNITLQKYNQSPGLCNYINYHSLMFFIFGIASICVHGFTLLAALYCNLFKRDKSIIKKSIKLANVFFVLMLGIEAFVFLVWIYLFAVEFVDELCECIVCCCRCWRTVLPGGLTARLEPVQIIITIPEQQITNNELDGTNFTKTEATAECPICLDASPNHTWFTIAMCGHQFHRACIAATDKNACPLCRGRIWKK
jgi:hypothetical protein